MRVTFSRPPVAAAILLPTTASLSAWFVVLAQDGFGLGDLRAFVFWSVLAGVVIYPVLHLYEKLSLGWNPVHAYVAGTILALGSATAWTVLVEAILGPWMALFSVPVFLCWAAGNVVSFASIVLLRQRKTWYLAILTLIVSIVVVLVPVRALSERPEPEYPALLVVLNPGLTEEEVELAWELFQVAPTPTPDGYNPEGLRTISRLDGEYGRGLLITFHAGTPEHRRDEVAQRSLRSPLVERVEVRAPKQKR